MCLCCPGIILFKTKMPVSLSIGLAIGVRLCYELCHITVASEVPCKFVCGQVDCLKYGLQAIDSVAKLVYDSCRKQRQWFVPGMMVSSFLGHRVK